ncbi:hypothetical protein RNAN_1829 [Rheinheimera nanhaiensis E407-8]|uniref:Uncharacterized protein n=1 Tax=Rheinheimera nanhaiensis E407-8 TaxID=562729 RepID=I1DXR3_9GAMM|nr:hypothetical protein RNAN_1829 [Rheinheimera nanhaiensis E407-8]
MLPGDQRLFSSLLPLIAKKAVLVRSHRFFAQFVTIFCNDFIGQHVYNIAALTDL